MEKKNRITFLEEGRLSEKEMGELYGGKTYGNCSDAGPICPIVSGDNFTITPNCAYNLYSCGSIMRFCSGENKLSQCSGTGVKQVVGTTCIDANNYVAQLTPTPLI